VKIYWSSRSIPELAGLDARQRQRAMHSVYWLTYRHWQTWAGIALWALPFAAGIRYGMAHDQPEVGFTVGGLVGSVFWIVAQINVTAYLYGDRLRQYALQERRTSGMNRGDDT
jgi:hypothetical protein